MYVKYTEIRCEHCNNDCIHYRQVYFNIIILILSMRLKFDFIDFNGIDYY